MAKFIYEIEIGLKPVYGTNHLCVQVEQTDISDDLYVKFYMVSGNGEKSLLGVYPIDEFRRIISKKFLKKVCTASERVSFLCGHSDTQFDYTTTYVTLPKCAVGEDPELGNQTPKFAKFNFFVGSHPEIIGDIHDKENMYAIPHVRIVMTRSYGLPDGKILNPNRCEFEFDELPEVAPWGHLMEDLKTIAKLHIRNRRYWHYNFKSGSEEKCD